MGTLIEVRDLRFRYEDGTEALRGVDFHLDSGETVIVFGPNGSGKTTFLLHLSGLLTGEGEIRICGLALARRNLTEIRKKIGLVFQDSDEQLFMPRVLEDVAYGLLNQGLTLPDALNAARKALEEVGVAHCADRAPYHLSAGEKRRVALAGVLAMKPSILVLDEPTSSLDPPGQRDLLGVLARLPQSKIISTHDAGFARAIGTRAVFFDHGRIAAEGGVDEMIRRFEWESSPLLTEPRP